MSWRPRRTKTERDRLSYIRKWRKDNPDRVQTWQQNRRAKRNSPEGKAAQRKVRESCEYREYHRAYIREWRAARNGMNYHAKLVEVANLPRPVECYGRDLVKVRAWARKTVEQYPSGRVEIYEITEQLADTVTGKKEP